MNKYVVIASLAFWGACYQYTRFQPTSSTLGKEVRIQLTDQGTAHIAGMVGPGVCYQTPMLECSSLPSMVSRMVLPVLTDTCSVR